jgi:hypothetical protein
MPRCKETALGTESRGPGCTMPILFTYAFLFSPSPYPYETYNVEWLDDFNDLAMLLTAGWYDVKCSGTISEEHRHDTRYMEKVLVQDLPTTKL